MYITMIQATNEKYTRNSFTTKVKPPAFKLGSTFQPVDGNLVCDHSNESYQTSSTFILSQYFMTWKLGYLFSSET